MKRVMTEWCLKSFVCAIMMAVIWFVVCFGIKSHSDAQICEKINQVVPQKGTADFPNLHNGVAELVNEIMTLPTNNEKEQALAMLQKNIRNYRTNGVPYASLHSAAYCRVLMAEAAFTGYFRLGKDKEAWDFLLDMFEELQVETMTG